MFNLSTIGGILGLGNSMYTSEQQLWYSGLFKTRQFSVQLIPSQADWGWIPGAQEPWDTKTSQLFVGGISPALTSVYQQEDQLGLLLTSKDTINWQFDTKSFSFGNNSDVGYQNQFMPFDTVFKAGFPGIGLNQSQFEVFYTILNENLHRYSHESNKPNLQRNESIIYVQGSTCADLYDSVYDLGFNLTLDQVIDYVI